MLAPLVTFLFKALRVSAAVWEHGEDWFPIYYEPNVSEFELEYGIAQAREVYNAQCLTKARERKKTVRGERAGYTDLFVPIFLREKVTAIL